MDYMMPEMDGLEACRAIVNNPATASIPVIMTTSNDTPEFRKRGVASGARGFLSKGLEDRELDNVLDSVAESKTEQPGGASVEGQKTEVSAEMLAMVRDQAINAARRASEEYFTGQLPGLEEQVVQVAENAARAVLSGQGGKPAPGVDPGELDDIRQRIDGIQKDPALRAMIAGAVREELAGSRRKGASAEPPPVATVSSAPETRRSGGSRIGRLFTLLLLVVVVYQVLVTFFADVPMVANVQQLVGSLLSKLQGP